MTACVCVCLYVSCFPIENLSYIKEFYVDLLAFVNEELTVLGK